MAKRLFMLAEDTKRNREENKELCEEVRRLASAFERLAYEIHHIGEREEHEREKLALQLEIDCCSSRSCWLQVNQAKREEKKE